MPRLLCTLSTVLVLAFPQLAMAQAMVGYADPSKPEYWARTVGFWINAEQLCGVQYDPQKREATTAQFAAQAGISVKQIKQMAVKSAAEAAPHFTKYSCQHAHNQARRMDLYAPGAKKRPFAKVPIAEMLEEGAKTQPRNTETVTYTLQIENPRRQPIIRVSVIGGEVGGTVCGGKKSCTRPVTLPKTKCGAEIRLHMYKGIKSTSVNWCQSGGTVRVEVPW